jgi:hypothetical protein
MYSEVRTLLAALADEKTARFGSQVDYTLQCLAKFAVNDATSIPLLVAAGAVQTCYTTLLASQSTETRRDDDKWTTVAMNALLLLGRVAAYDDGANAAAVADTGVVEWLATDVCPRLLAASAAAGSRGLGDEQQRLLATAYECLAHVCAIRRRGNTNATKATPAWSPGGGGATTTATAVVRDKTNMKRLMKTPLVKLALKTLRAYNEHNVKKDAGNAAAAALQAHNAPARATGKNAKHDVDAATSLAEATARVVCMVARCGAAGVGKTTAGGGVNVMSNALLARGRVAASAAASADVLEVVLRLLRRDTSGATLSFLKQVRSATPCD